MDLLKPRELVVATHNVGKVDEFVALLAEAAWRCKPLPTGAPEFEETGTTFAENARGKALFYAAWTGLPALADDSGLIIDALGGEPGVYSARYIDPAISQDERNAAVLERLQEIADPARSARFVCHLAFADAGVVVHEAIGTCEGHITRAARGDQGFGYDPIFRPAGASITFAQMERAAKAARSHRGRAVREMIRHLVS